MVCSVDFFLSILSRAVYIHCENSASTDRSCSPSFCKKMTIKNFNPDDKNFNSHTEEGMSLLEKSLEKVGIIEAVTVSRDDKVISGNARLEKIKQKYGDDVAPIVVETDGSTPIIIKRTDISSDSKQFFEASILANTVSQKNNKLDVIAVKKIAVQEMKIDVVDLGVEIKPCEKKKETRKLEPYNRVHYLFSVPPDRVIDIVRLIDELKSFDFVDYEASSN
jgi:hypothetical protein